MMKSLYIGIYTKALLLFTILIMPYCFISAASPADHTLYKPAINILYPLTGIDEFSSVPKIGNHSPASATSVIPIFSWQQALKTDSKNEITYYNRIAFPAPPTITCPSNVTAANTPGLCSASISGLAPFTNDPDNDITTLTWAMTGATTASSPASGINNIPSPYVFNVGITTITYVVTDAGGTSVSCSFTVNVNDTQLPVVTCPANINKTFSEGQCSAVVAVGNATATDNCGIAPASITGLRSDGLALNAPYPVGVTTITWSATDMHGNTNSCNQLITITQGIILVNYNFVSATAYPISANQTATGISCSATSTEPFNVLTTLGTTTGALAFVDNLIANPTIFMDPSTGTNTRYFQFHISGDSLYKYRKFKLYVQARRGNRAAQTINFAYSTDPFSFTVNGSMALLSTGVWYEKVVDWSGVSLINNHSDLYIRLFASNGSGGIGDNRLFIDNFQVVGVDGPLARPNSASIPENTPVIIPVLNNDTYGCNGPSVSNPISIISFPSQGTTVLNADSTITYTPNPNVNGNDSFIYQICDATGSCDSSIVKISIAPVSYDPTVSCPGTINSGSDIGSCGATINDLSATTFDQDNNITTLTWTMTGANNDASPLTGINNILSGYFFNLGVSTITYYVTDADGGSDSCSFTVTVFDSENPSLVCASDTIIMIPNCALQTGLVTLDPPVVVYDNCGILNLTNNAPAQFSVGNTSVIWILNDVNGLSTPCEQIVTVINEPPMNLTGSNTPADCGSSNGTATVIASGGAIPYTYSWNTVPVQTTQTAVNLLAGDYDITVTDANGCTNSITVTVDQVPNSLSVSVTTVDVACFSDSTGSATALATGGFPPYTYAWLTLPIQTTATATNLPAGTYTVAVFDSLGCFVPAFATINEPASALTAAVTDSLDAICNGTNTGMFTVNGSGGTPPYQYSINGGAYQSGGAFSNLVAGFYTISVIDDNNCQFNSLTVELSEPGDSLTSTLTKTDVPCNGEPTGSATVTVTGGVAPYSYSWNTIPVQTTSIANNLSAGSYICKVTDFVGCELMINVTITEPAPIALDITTIDVACFGEATGTATVVPSGGVPPYSYAWLTVPIQTGATATNLEAGSYTLAVFDSLGCFMPGFITISQPLLPLTATLVNVSNVQCTGGNTGSLTVSASGGTPPYQYSINGGAYQAGGFFGSLAPGLYTISVIDANNCQFNSLTATILGASDPLTATLSKTDAGCNGEATGSATVSVTGGVAPYTYSWNTVPVQTTATANNLAAGNYICKVTDFTACELFVNVTIAEPSPIVLDITTVDVACYGEATGSATVIPSGGIPPYSYAWLTVPIQTGATATNLEAGSYTLAVFDSLGCFMPGFITISQPLLPLTATLDNVTNVLCTGGNTGSLTVSGAGGTPPYQYSINGGAYQANGFFGTLPAGFYTISVIDTNNCQFNSLTATIIGAANPLMGSVVSYDVTCNGELTGSAKVTVTGGVLPYTYLWNTVPAQTTDSAINLAAGNYVCNVIDFAGCVLSLSTTIDEPTPIIMDITVTDVACFGEATGSATVVPSGGIPPYSYAWLTMPIQTGATATNLLAGSYTLAVFDSLGCFMPGFVTILEPLLPLTATLVNVTNELCTGGNSGSLTIAGAGGTLPYQYSINGGTYQPSGFFGSLGAGFYTISVIDANNCQFNTLTATILGPANPLMGSIAKMDVRCNGEATGFAKVTVSGGVAPYSYTWNTVPAQTTDSAILLPAGSYICTIVDFAGCILSLNVTINEPSPIVLDVTTNDVACFGEATGSATVVPSGGMPPYTYAWLTVPIQTSATATNLLAGAYTLAVFDSLGCFMPGFVLISEPASALSGTIVTQTDVTCLGNATGSVTVLGSGGTPGYEYCIDGGAYQSDGTFLSLFAGPHTVTVRDANNCTFDVAVLIVGPFTGITATITNLEDIKCFGDTTGTVTITVNTGIPPYFFSLNGGTPQSSGTFSNLAAGNYIITISDGSICTLDVPFIIAQPSAPLTTLLTVLNVSCFGGSNGSATVIANGGTSPYTYSWNTVPVQTTSTASNLTAGTYIVTVTDSNNCTKADTAILTAPATPLTATIISLIPVDCAGNTNGSVTVAGSGGTPGYQYSIDGITYQSGQTFSNLAAGNYTVTVRDTNNCTIPVPVQITVLGVLVAENDTLSATEDLAISGNVMDNDHGFCFPPVNVTSNTAPLHGSVVMNADGTFTYTPALNYNGTDFFTYTITDINGADSTATVFIVIDAVNDPPVTFNEVLIVNYNLPQIGNVLFNGDYDPDSTALSVNIIPVISAVNGTFSIGSDGSFIYTPNLNYIGPDMVVVSVCDAGIPLPSACTNDTIFITVLPPNQPPVAINEYIGVCADAAFIGTVLNGGTVFNGDTDPENNLPLTVNSTPLIGPANGVFSITDTLSGTFNYTPTAGYTGTDMVVVTICDSGIPVECMNDTIFILINEPVAADAGLSQMLCNADVTFLVGNSPSTGTGSWTLISGPNIPSIFPPQGSVAVATGLMASAIPYVFGYSIDNNGCIMTDTMSVINYVPPTPAYAGVDQSFCNASGFVTTNMAANTPVFGTGLWSQLSGPNTAIFLNPTDPNSAVTGLTYGEYAFQWAITNGICQADADVVNLIISQPVTADAGFNQTICEGSVISLSAATASNYTSVLWTSTGTGLFNNPSLLNPIYTPSITDIVNGEVVLTLTATGYEPCPPVYDQISVSIQQAPLVFAGNDAIVCSNSDYTVPDATAEYCALYYWTTTGLGILTGDSTLNPTYEPSTGETGNILLILNGIATGLCSNTSDTLLLTIMAGATADAGPDTTLCEKDSYSIAGSSASDYSVIEWTTSGTGTFDNSGSINPTYTPSPNDINDGFVVLTITASGNTACPDAVDDMTLSIVRGPTAHAGPDASVCETSAFTVTEATAINYTGILWTTTGTGTLTNETTLEPVYTPAPTETGSILLILTVTGNGACELAIDSLNLFIQPATLADAGIDLLTCELAPVQILNAAVQNSTTLLWTTSGNGSFNDPTSLNPVYSPGSLDAAMGIVMLTLHASGTSPCTDVSDPLILTINKGPIADAGPDLNSCTGTSHTISQADAANYSTITWTVSPLTAGTLTGAETLSPVFTAAAGFTGTATLTLTVQGIASCSDIVVSDNLEIAVNSSLVANAGADQSISAGASTILDGSVSGGTGFLAWSWQPASLLLNPTIQSPVTLPLNETTTFVLTILDLTTGCMDSDSMVVTTGSGGTSLNAIADYDTTLVNVPITIKVLANDINPDGEPLEVTLCGYPSYGIVVLNSDKTITYTPYSEFTGNDMFCYRICNILHPTLCSDTMVFVNVKQPSLDDLFVYTGVSPNGDGNNDTWKVKGIEKYPDNVVLIFNRWGDKVREFANYNNTSRSWDGTNENGDALPNGTYFYILDIKNVGVLKGWIFIRGEK